MRWIRLPPRKRILRHLLEHTGTNRVDDSDSKEEMPGARGERTTDQPYEGKRDSRKLKLCSLVRISSVQGRYHYGRDVYEATLHSGADCKPEEIVLRSEEGESPVAVLRFSARVVP